jgi:hypothetical protein
LLTYEGIYNKLKRMTEAMDLKGVEQYYQDPKNNGGQQEQTPPDPNNDPAVIKAHVDALAKIEVAKIAADAQIIVAGMQPPPALAYGGDSQSEPESPQEDAQEPQDEHSVEFGPEDVHAAVSALSGAPAPDPGQQQ